MLGLRMAFCPVSHIPLNELRMAVVFKNDARVVYDAEQLVHWLKNYKLVNPMTNAVIQSGRVSSVLVPFRLPHMSPEDLDYTAQYLEQQGYLVWRPSGSGWRDCVGMCLCMVGMSVSLYIMLIMLECSLDALEHKDLSFMCLAVPPFLSVLNIITVVCFYWFVPDVRAYAREAVLLCMGLFALTHFSLLALGNPIETQRRAAELLTLHRELAQVFMHPRVLAVVERTLALRLP